MGVLPIGLAPEQSSGAIDEQNSAAAGAIRRHGMRAVAWFLLITIAALIPPLAPDFAGSASLILVFLLLATALSLETAVAAVPDFAIAANFAAGAYCVALWPARSGWTMLECLPACGAIGLVIGVALGTVLVRRSAAVFAIVTLSFGAVVQTILNNWNALAGGANGFRIATSVDLELYYYVLLAIVLCAGAIAWRLRRSSLALALRAARENEIACCSIGISSAGLKIRVIAVAGALAGIAGGLYAVAQGTVRPDQFDVSTTATVFMLVLAGGTRSQLRLSVAATLIIGIQLIVPFFAEYRLLTCGIALVLWPLIRRWVRRIVEPDANIRMFTRVKAQIE